MKNLILVLSAALLVSCEYEDTVIENYNTTIINNPVTELPASEVPPEKSFPESLRGSYDPYQLPDAGLTVISKDSIKLDVTGFWDTFKFSVNDSITVMNADSICVHKENKTFRFFKTNDISVNDIKVEIQEDGPEGSFFELGWFVKQ